MAAHQPSGFAPMPSTVFDSAIFRDAFGSLAMREVFSDAATVARYVEVVTRMIKVKIWTIERL